IKPSASYTKPEPRPCPTARREPLASVSVLTNTTAGSAFAAISAKLAGALIPDGSTMLATGATTVTAGAALALGAGAVPSWPHPTADKPPARSITRNVFTTPKSSLGSPTGSNHSLAVERARGTPGGSTCLGHFDEAQTQVREDLL